MSRMPTIWIESCVVRLSHVARLPTINEASPISVRISLFQSEHSTGGKTPRLSAEVRKYCLRSSGETDLTGLRGVW